MDHIFIEETIDDIYRIAFIDKHRIFNSNNPENLATVFECSNHHPTADDNAQIFYALAPSIDGLNIFADLIHQYRSYKLNTWNIISNNQNDDDNIFVSVRPLNYQEKVKLYETNFSITPGDVITENSNSLFSLVKFANGQIWKNGTLQRIIDCLVLPQYRRQPNVYALIDSEYRRLLRFKFETEHPKPVDYELIMTIKRILVLLGLKHSHDTKVFKRIPNSINDELKCIPIYNPKLSVKDNLSKILVLWSGSKVIDHKKGYKLEVDNNVVLGLSYMQQLLITPDKLTILEAQF